MRGRFCVLKAPVIPLPLQVDTSLKAALKLLHAVNAMCNSCKAFVWPDVSQLSQLHIEMSFIFAPRQPSSGWPVSLVTQLMSYISHLCWFHTILIISDSSPFNVIFPSLLQHSPQSQQFSKVIFSIFQGSLIRERDLFSLPTSLRPWRPETKF